MKPLTTITDPRLVKALAHPLRLRILSVLERRTASPKEIADELDYPLTHVSYHVRQLAEFGLIKLVRTTQVRGAIEHHYRLEAHPKISDEAWRQAPEIAKQTLVSAVLGQVSSQVNAAAAQGGFSRDGAYLVRLPLELDEQGWRETTRAMEKLVNELERIQEKARSRTEAHTSDAGNAEVVLMFFEVAAEPNAKIPARRRARSGTLRSNRR